MKGQSCRAWPTPLRCRGSRVCHSPPVRHGRGSAALQKADGPGIPPAEQSRWSIHSISSTCSRSLPDNRLGLSIAITKSPRCIQESWICRTLLRGWSPALSRRAPMPLSCRAEMPRKHTA